MQENCVKCGLQLSRYPTINCDKCRLYSQCKLHIKYTKIMDSDGNTPSQKYCFKCFESDHCTSCGVEAQADIYCDGCNTEKCLYCFGMFSREEEMRNDGKFRIGALCNECVSAKKTTCGYCSTLLFPSLNSGCEECGDKLCCINHLKTLDIGADENGKHYKRICGPCFEKRGPKICGCNINSCVGYNCDECKSVVCSTTWGKIVQTGFGKKTICGRCIRNNAVQCKSCTAGEPAKRCTNKVHPDLMRMCGMCKQKGWCENDMRKVNIPVDGGAIMMDEYCINCYYASQPKNGMFSCDKCNKSIPGVNIARETNLRGVVKFTCADCSYKHDFHSKRCVICKTHPKNVLDCMKTCHRCWRTPICESHMHETHESSSIGFDIYLKRVSYCDTCFEERKRNVNKSKEEYEERKIAENKVEIEEWVTNNPEWEDIEREKYIREAEEKWAKIMAKKAFEKMETHDRERIKRKRAKGKR